jgi:hypothetical protein
MLVVPTVPYSQEEMGKIISLRVEEARTFGFFSLLVLTNRLQEGVKLDAKALQVRCYCFI